MSRIKKLGIPADLKPTFDILERIADGEDIDIDVGTVVKNIALAQYYLRGKEDGLKVKKISDKAIAKDLIEVCSQELKHILEIVTDTE